MRSIGAAERALELMCDRLRSRIAFGRPLAEQSVWHERIGESRYLNDQARLLTPQCRLQDGHGGQEGGACLGLWFAEAYAHQRTVRIVDGPDEAHSNAIAKPELARRAAPARV